MAYLAYLTYGAFAAIPCLGLILLYRIYFHPLAGIPGPKLTAASRFYEWYSDCIQTGTFWHRVRDLHRQYGPIVRIGPNEVHIDDPDWFDVLYNPNAKLDKDPWYYGLMGNNDSAFAAVDYNVHRIKRNKQNPFFSRQNVDKSAPILARVLDNVLSQLEQHRGTGKPVQIRCALKSYASDVVCEYCFRDAMDFVKEPNFGKTFHDGQHGFVTLLPWFRHFPSLVPIVMATPAWVLPYMDKGAQAATSFIRFIESSVRESVRQSEEKETNGRKTLIRELYESDMPAELRSQWHLEQEAQALVAAGTLTVARTLESGLFYILENPEITRKLTDELRAFKPEEPGLLTHRDLESLPYLSAVILECQRMVPAVPGRFPRINRTEDMFYQDYRIPKGTTIGMSQWDVLLNDKIWGNALEFDPSRWLNPDHRAHLQKYMVPFGRGSRSCVGQNLAVAEVYTVLGNILRRFDMELVDTDEREIETVRDCFAALPYKGSVGVQVVLR